MNRFLIGAALAPFVLAAAPVAAQSAPPPPGVAQGTTPVAISRSHTPPVVRSSARVTLIAGSGMTRDDFVRRVRTSFAELDTNHDGYVTRREIAAVRDRRMRGMAEMRAGMERNPGEERRGADGHQMKMPDPAAMFDRLDTNHDGVISREEFMAAHERMHDHHGLAMRDADMMRSRAHMGSVEGPMRGMGVNHGMRLLAHLFDAADANHDGRLTLQEAEAAAQALFDRMDLNHDGRVTPEERRDMHDLMHKGRAG